MATEVNAFRSRLDQLVTRIRTLGVRETLSIEREVLRRILKTTIAATLSWLAAEAIGSPRPALAALATIIVLQVTVRSSLQRSIQLTVAVILGLGGSTAFGALVGVHWWSITLIVLAGLIAGELFRLGALSGQVAISAMLALSLGTGYGVTRTEDTAIGALIGVLVNVAISPASYVSEAGRRLRAVGEDLGALLREMGDRLAEADRPPGETTFRRWLTRARDLAADGGSAADIVRQSEESLRFNPRARTESQALSRLVEGRQAVDHAIAQARGIARGLLDLPRPLGDGRLVAALAGLGPVLGAAGDAVSAFGRLVQDPTQTPDRDALAGAAARARRLAQPVADALAGLYQHGSSGAERDRQRAAAGMVALLVDVERLIREVDLDDGVHRQAVLGSG